MAIKNTVTISFTQEELNKHEHDIREQAFRQAAVCTLRKLELFNIEPLGNVVHDLERYRTYLMKTYKIKPLEYFKPR
jgi:hypothetical protein